MENVYILWEKVYFSLFLSHKESQPKSKRFEVCGNTDCYSRFNVIATISDKKRPAMVTNSLTTAIIMKASVKHRTEVCLFSAIVEELFPYIIAAIVVIIQEAASRKKGHFKRLWIDANARVWCCSVFTLLAYVLFLLYFLDEMSVGRKEAFETFRRDYVHNDTIEENKHNLKQRLVFMWCPVSHYSIPF